MGSSDLRAFHGEWEGSKVLELSNCYGRPIFARWPIGVGKSYNIDDTIQAAIETHDLIVALFPTRNIIEERRWIIRPPPILKIVNIRPRPKEDCGGRNEEWEQYETKGLGTLGRERICESCPRATSCFWPKQYGKEMEGARVVFATQANLDNNPFFIERIKQWTNCNGKVLVIFDELNFITNPRKRVVNHGEMKIFLKVIDSLSHPIKTNKKHKRWIKSVEGLLKARTKALRKKWILPTAPPKWSLLVQALGNQMYGGDFRFLAYDLMSFCKSAFNSREKLENGDLSFSQPFFLKDDVIIYSGTGSLEYLKFRTGLEDLVSPFDNHSFNFSNTKWYNFASNIGTAKYFIKNSLQIYDFFAQLIAQRLSEGKRPLIITKKKFIQHCKEGLEKKFREMGMKDIRVLVR